MNNIGYIICRSVIFKLNMCSRKVLVLIAIVIICLCPSAKSQETPLYFESVAKKQIGDCFQEADLQCVKLKVLANAYLFLNAKSLYLSDGVQILYTGDRSMYAETARDIVNKDWTYILFDFIPKLMSDLSIKIPVFPGGSVLISRSSKKNGLISLSMDTENDILKGRKYI